MRKNIIAVFVIVLVSLSLNIGCTNDGVIKISQRMFVAQVSDIYLNADDYFGRIVTLEGIFVEFQDPITEDISYYVVRYTPEDGCCLEGMVGFEVKMSAAIAEPYPHDDAWVEVTGILKTGLMDYYQSPYIELSSLNVLSKRGAEYVR